MKAQWHGLFVLLVFVVGRQLGLFINRCYFCCSLFLLIVLVIPIKKVDTRKFDTTKLNMPITLLDIILLPVTLVFGYVLLKDLFTGSGKGISGDVGLKATIGYMAFSIFVLLPLGVYCIVLGGDNPFTLLSGVKGNVHGYTAIVLGVFIVGLSAGLLFRFAKKIRDKIAKKLS